MSRPMNASELALANNLFDIVDSSSLGVIIPLSSIVELTLNHPRTAKFKKLTKDLQIQLYIHLFEFIIAKTPGVKDSQYTFEECKSGFIHLHGYLYIEHTRSGSMEGLVLDIVRNFFTRMPKRYSVMRMDQFYPLFCRYRSPMILAQYRDGSDSTRLETWKSYITKDQK